MQHEFLSAMLPTEGKYCAFVVQGKFPKNVFVETMENLYDTVMQYSGWGNSAYFALSTFDDTGFRKAENARFIKALFFDLDCGWNEEKQKWKDFHSKRDAVAGLYDFLGKVGVLELGKPWLVDSGSGVHAYLPFPHAVPVVEWKKLALAVKEAAKRHRFPLDHNVSGDAARVLRVPDSLNFKTDPPRTVLLRQTGDFFEFDTLVGLFKEYEVALPTKTAALAIPGTRPVNAPMSAVALAIANNSTNSFRKIVQATAEGKGCMQLAHYMENASDDGMEPLWRGMLSIAKYCEDSEKASIKLSALHPYDEDRRVTKMHEIKGPYACGSIESVSGISCTGCPHKGKITNPLALGRITNTVTEREVPSEEPDEERIVTLPPPPRGYAYGTNGGLYYKKPAEGEEGEKLILLTNHDFYMSQMFKESDGSYSAEFVARKDFAVTKLDVPAEAVANPKDALKVLARNGVLSAGGVATDGYLAGYVRACIQDRAASGRHVTVPPNLGWQDNGDFAIGNRVISARGRAHDYTFKSSRIGNVVNSTMPKGDLKEWRKIPDMMRDKAEKNPDHWGHCAITLTNFASPLMILAPKAARAGCVNLAGKESGGGKTVVSQISNSIFGDFAGSGLSMSASTSETTILQRAGLLGSISLNVDEITTKNRTSNNEWLPNFMYAFSHGAHKVKGAANGNAEIQQNCVWSSIALLSTNDPAAEAMMTARQHSSLGEMRRFLEWKLPPNWTISFTPEEEETLKLMETNNGVAGIAWIEWIQDNKELARQRWNEIRDYWIKYSGAKANERFWTNMITSYLTAAILTNPKHANLTDFNFQKLCEFFLGLVQYMRKIIDNNRMDALDIFNAYLREYNHQMIFINPTGIASVLGADAKTNNSAVRGRSEWEVTPGHVDIFIETRMMKVHCANLGHSYMDFIKELGSIFTITETRKDLLQGTKRAPLRVMCMKLTRPTTNMTEEDRYYAGDPTKLSVA